MQEGIPGAVELGVDVGGVTEEIAVEVIVGIGGGGLEGESESTIGVFVEGLVGFEAGGFEVMDDLLQEQVLQGDFDLLGAEDAPGVGGELGGEEALIGGAGGEVGFKAGLEGFEVIGALEGEEGELGGEAVLESV